MRDHPYTIISERRVRASELRLGPVFSSGGRWALNSFPLESSGPTGGSSPPNGTIHYSRIRVQYPTVINNGEMFSTSNCVGTTNSWIGIYDSASRSLIAGSGDGGSVNGLLNQWKSWSFPTPVTLPVGSDIFAARLITGGAGFGTCVSTGDGVNPLLYYHGVGCGEYSGVCNGPFAALPDPLPAYDSLFTRIEFWGFW